MNQPTLVITTVTASHSDYLLDFLISIRTLGEYQGELVIIDYGITDHYRSICEDFDARVISLKPKGHPGSSRFLDMIAILENNYPGHIIVQFDVDIWFQHSIMQVFPMAAHSEGCIFTREYVNVQNIPPSKLNYGKPVNKEKHNFYESIMLKFMQEFNGQINIGFMAGKYSPFLNKLLKARELYSKDFSDKEFCSDQYIFNVLYDRGKDSLDGQLYNCVLTDIKRHNANFILSRSEEFHKSAIFSQKNEVIGVHCSAIVLKENQLAYRFYTNHKEVFRNKLLHTVLRKAVRVDILLS